MQQETKHVLIIDDEPIIRHALEDYLKDCGYEASAANDGLAGLNKVRTEHFDVILADLRMPKMDGMELISMLQIECPQLPVIVVSGTGLLNDAIEAIRRGAWDYITKPVYDMDEIKVVIERVLDKASLIAERDRYQQEIERLNRGLETEVTRQTQDLQARNRELTVLNRVISTAAITSDPVRILRVLCAELALALNVPQVSAILFSSASPTTHVIAEYCEPGRNSALGLEISFDVSPITDVVESKQPLFIAEASTDERLRSHWPKLRRRDLATLLFVPLVAHDRVIAILNLETTKPRVYHVDDMELVQSAASAAAQALEAVKLHQQLRQHAETLENTVAQRTTELRDALKRAQAADEAKSQFLSSVSHELRTPLTSIRLYLNLLSQGKTQNWERYIESLKRETDRLQMLIEELLDLSRLDLGKVTPQFKPVDLNQLLAALVADRLKLFAARGLDLYLCTSQEATSIPADARLLEQVATNLLTNAMNYTQTGGEVCIYTDLIEEANKTWCTFSVKDTGPGISEEEQAHIFERFYRGIAAQTSDAPGTGLGLAISQGIVDLHQGKITLDSTPGEGSTFTVWLPLGL